MNKISAVIRKLTVPPVFTALLLLVVYGMRPAYFSSAWQLRAGIFFLAILPVSAYPLQKHIPGFQDRGREGQRSLAMIFSFAGYLLGAVTAFLFRVSPQQKIIYLEYLLCGVLILVLNKVFSIKASGHACGTVGPAALLLYFELCIPAFIGIALVVPVFVSSIRTKQHTLPQLLLGSAVPSAVLLVLSLFA